jgi:hypothetical protein
MATSDWACEGEGKSRWWFLTLNNYTKDEIVKMLSINFAWLVYQGEECPTTGTPHIHACIYYKNAVVMPKRHIPRGHWEKVFRAEACVKYCTKEESRVDGPFEYGERPRQGTRTDLATIAEKYVNSTERDFADENPEHFVKYYRGLRELKNVMSFNDRDRTKPPIVIWSWGKTGCGKTYYPVEKFGEGNYYMKDGTKWWDGYTQQECIIIDDFDGAWPYRDFLRLLDKYAYQGQVKGGYVKINSPYIYITCEHPPSHFWDGNELDQVSRRITGKVWYCWCEEEDREIVYKRSKNRGVQCDAEASSCAYRAPLEIELS